MARPARRSRKDQWDQMRNSMTGSSVKPKGIESREHIPEKACGKCQNFSANAYASDGSGYCRALKTGSDILANSPIFVFEGDAGLMCRVNMDAYKCQKYEGLAYIDTDNTECADPRRKRTGRQMSKAAQSS